MTLSTRRTRVRYRRRTISSKGDRFDSWLQAGQLIQYEIWIEQTTRSGATYTSGMKINIKLTDVGIALFHLGLF